MTRREKAILKRNLFVTFCAVVLVAFIALMVFIISAVAGDGATSSDSETSSSQEASSKQEVSSAESSETISSETVSSSEPQTSQIVDVNGVKLDAKYKNLLLVNGENPLPEDYNYQANLATIPSKYVLGSLNQFDKDALPYLTAMIDAARKDGVSMGVLSPYRSYATQKRLYENQIQKQISYGVSKEQAPDKAATVVARPGTSEHNTGLALDINQVTDAFENTGAYSWLKKNAENYGFVMRYSREKQPLTGVIHESWHWRFVGIEAAKEMNKLDMCLEEYVEYKK